MLGDAHLDNSTLQSGDGDGDGNYYFGVCSHSVKVCLTISPSLLRQWQGVLSLHSRDLFLFLMNAMPGVFLYQGNMQILVRQWNLVDSSSQSIGCIADIVDRYMYSYILLMPLLRLRLRLLRMMMPLYSDHSSTGWSLYEFDVMMNMGL